jgi:RNA polymerase sigma-70 factor (ECF subfamily)
VKTLSAHEVTRLLKNWRGGDQAALDRLIPLVEHELHHLAHRYMVRERVGVTLQTTALVNEAYLRLIDAHEVDWKDRVHFFSITANLMRRILVEFARARNSKKRGGGVCKVEFNDAVIASPERDVDLVAVDEALRQLAEIDVRAAKVVELRFFGGLNVEETAEALGVSDKTIMRDWQLAKVWLLRELKRRG